MRESENPSFLWLCVFKWFALSWAAPAAKEASETADSSYLAQMYFHLLIRGIYFWILVLLLHVLDIEKNAVSEPQDTTWWNNVVLGMTTCQSHLLSVSVRREKVSLATIAPSDNSSCGLFSWRSWSSDS